MASSNRVLFLAERTAIPDGQIDPHGSSVHVAATLFALRERFDVLALGAAPGTTAQAAPRLLRSLFPARVRGLRRDVGYLCEDRAFYARALKAARSFRPDVVYMRDEYFTFAGLRLARRVGVPFVLEVNGLLELDARTMYRSLGEPIGGWIERIKLARADAIVVETSGLAEHLEERGAPRSRLFVVPNTVSDARVAAEPRARRAERVVIGWIGHLMAWHADSLMTLADVARRVVDEADVRFLIVGDGPRLDEVRDRVHALGLDARFEFTGSVPYEDVPRALEAVDVAVIPDVFDYAFPVKLVEFGAAGIPVVMQRGASLDTLLEPNVEYLPFDRNDPDGLHNALLRIVRDDELRVSLAAALHRAVRERFTWSVAANKLEAVVLRVLR
ncbi:MAG TPA: glycosyltransferase family 4 protein [Gaiellaceae bacterium]|nr:glycosyltransferase family 4 protein [Gaiellaceae bacterium]